MAINESLLIELQQEAAATRKVLENIPEDKLAWRPHEKSMTLSRLATHIAELPAWGEVMLSRDEFDIAPPGAPPFQPQELGSVAEILDLFDKNVAKLRELAGSTSDEDFRKQWTLLKGGNQVFTAPRIGVVRSTLFNHTIHHRGQLTVFLRLVGAPVPGTYGPSADETFE
ncbi:MAG: DinB family protein [Gemmatimonadota bacterium]|nr:MAG: DinB family protein [Gemmatimonadota bacterium]